MTLRDLAFIVPAALLGWFGHGVVTHNLPETVASLVICGYLIIAGLSVDTCLRMPKPLRGPGGNWVAKNGDELSSRAVLMWYHGLFVIFALIAIVILSASRTFFQMMAAG